MVSRILPHRAAFVAYAGVLLGCVLVLWALPVEAQTTDYYVATPSELVSAISQVVAGDTITMANGRWTNVAIRFNADGMEGDSIRLRAETPGAVILDGASTLSIAGDYLVVDGLRFEGGALSGGHVIQFRGNSSDLANHSRLTNTVIVDFNPSSSSIEYKWVSIYGTHNRVDHSYFAGKTNAGATLVVWLQDAAQHEPTYHRVDHNHFGLRPPLGSNGGETIRIGTSSRSMQDAYVTVERNLFEQCDGETEIISNKSGKNVFRANTFLESQGTLTLRHGNGARVEGNFFIGNGLPDTGGVRIIGEDHVVVNNYFENVQGSGFRAALSIMNGVPNSPLNRYFQVKNALVAFNTVVGSAYSLILGLGADAERTLPPENVTFANNVILTDGRTIIREDDTPINMVWAANVMHGGDLGIADPGGIRLEDPLLDVADDGLWRPSSESPLIDAAEGAYPSVVTDVDGQPREAEAFDIGADEHSAAPVVSRPLTPDDVGPAWWRAVSVEDDVPFPTTALLEFGAVYPNPVRSMTMLPLRLARAGRVEVTAYDLLGRRVAVVAERTLPAGAHRLDWRVPDVPAGTYVLVARMDGYLARQTVILLH